MGSSTKTNDEKYSDEPLLENVEADDLESGSSSKSLVAGTVRNKPQATLRLPLIRTLTVSVILNLILGFVIFYRDYTNQKYSRGYDAGLEACL
jgi:hypothetical protein